MNSSAENFVRVNAAGTIERSVDAASSDGTTKVVAKKAPRPKASVAAKGVMLAATVNQITGGDAHSEATDQGQGCFSLITMVQLTLTIMAALYMYEKMPQKVKELISDVIAVARNAWKQKSRPEDARHGELPETDSTVSQKLKEELEIQRHDLNLMRLSREQVETAMSQAVEEEKELRNDIMETLQERDHIKRCVDTLRVQCTDFEALVVLLQRQCEALKVEAANITAGPSDDQCGPGATKLCYVATNSTVHLPGCRALNGTVNPICDLRPCLICIGRHGKHVVATESSSSARSSRLDARVRPNVPRTIYKTRFVDAG